MSWNIHLIGTRAAVSTAVVQFTSFPLATAVAKHIAFAPDPSPWVALESTGHDSNVYSLRIHFFTPAPESPAEPVPEVTPPPATTTG
jgi:hypothetical protein